MPTLNIKNERVYQLARELADRTGSSMTSIIAQALVEKLETLNHQRDDARAERLARIDRLLDQMAARFGPVTEEDPTAFLYDQQTGLPR